MTETPSPFCLAGTEFAFAPVLQQRVRRDGWTAAQQERFILALREMGSVGPAARAVGMGRVSAYRLRERAGAEGFAWAWDLALEIGRAKMFDVAMDQAINGTITVRVSKGGSVLVKGGPSMRLVSDAIRAAPPPR